MLHKVNILQSVLAHYYAKTTSAWWHQAAYLSAVLAGTIDL